MARKKSEEFRAVGFRMPARYYDILAGVARERGIDVSAVLNSLIAEALPALEDWLRRRSRGKEAIVDSLVKEVLVPTGMLSEAAASALTDEQKEVVWRSLVKALG